MSAAPKSQRTPGRIALAVLLGVLSTGGCADDGPPVTVRSIQSSGDADQESWNVDFTITEDGLPRIQARAGHVLKYERPDSIYMLLQSAPGDTARVRVDIFNEAGGESAIVQADRIYYYEREHRFVALGAVTAESISGSSIASEHLEWTENDRKLRTPGFATISSDAGTFSGYRLEANEDLSESTLELPSGRRRVGDQESGEVG